LKFYFKAGFPPEHLLLSAGLQMVV